MLKVTISRNTIWQCLRALLACSVLLTGWAKPARANTIYTYTGQSLGNFTGGFTCLVGATCPITGSFTVSQALPPNMSFSPAPGVLSWSFTDGVNTWTNSNSFGNLDVTTGTSGNIASWSIGFFLPTPSGGFFALSTVNTPAVATDLTEELINCVPGSIISCTPIILASNTNQPGIWSVSSTPPAPIPEPASVLYLSTGLIGVLGVARRRWWSMKISERR